MRILLAGIAIALLTVMTSAQESPAPAKLTPMKTGEFWYGMYQPDGKPEGYARIRARETKQGGIHVDWELHITYDGGNYEEERAITLGKDQTLTFSEIKANNKRIFAAREGKIMVGKTGVDDLRAEVTDDATTGMGFILAAFMPLEKDAQFARTEFNEANGLAKIDALTLKVADKEELKLPDGNVTAWRVNIARKAGELPVWVNESREIVQIDWGQGNLMKLHRSSTKALFKPVPPLFAEIEADNLKTLQLQAEFAGFTANEMFDHWAKPDLLTKWWPPKAEIEPKVDGKYVLTWPGEKEGEIRWQLVGKITEYDAGKRFGFTWKWSYEKEADPELRVSITISEIKGGVQLTVQHGPFTESEADQQNRASLKQGWEFFGAKLKKLKG